MPREPNDQEQEIEHVEDEVEQIEEPDEAGEDSEQDAGDGEGQDEAQDDEEGGSGSVGDEPARKPSRAQSRIQSLTTTARDAKDKADKLERELAEIRADNRRRDQLAQQESPQQRAERRALMAPEEVMREDLRESEQRTQTLLHQHRMETQEREDKANYNSILRDNPNLKKFDAEVEKVRLEQQARGSFVPREVLLDLAIGRAARASAGKSGSKAKQQGQKRIAAQTTKPGNSKGDTATARGRQGASLEDRLGDIPI